MWRLVPSDEYVRRSKWFSKKKRGQLNAVLNNLKRFADLLNSGVEMRPLPCGFLRDEGLGILRISESGSPSNVAATRLYVYPDPDTETIYLLTIGDKSTQAEDIRLCKEAVKELKADPSLGGMRDDEHAQGEEGEDAEDG